MSVVHHIAFTNQSTLPDSEVVWHAAAIEKQLREHACPLWGIEPPGVAFYKMPENFTPEQAAILNYVNDDGDPTAAGEHSKLVNVVYGLIDLSQSPIASLTASHEALEMVGDPDLDRTTPGPDGLDYYVELCDPVEHQSYEIEVELFGEKRSIPVSDFVLPRWFDLLNTTPGDDRMTYLGQSLKPFQLAPGGYQVAAQKDGNVVYLGARPRRQGPRTRVQRFASR